MSSSPLRVLSLNVNLLGHAAYGRTLEATVAARYSPEVDLRALRLTDEMDGDTLARAVFSLGTRRLPGLGEESDADYYRLRAESILAWTAARALRRRLSVMRAAGDPPPDVVHLHTRTAALHAAGAVGRLPVVIDTDTTTAALARHRAAGGPAPATYRPLIARERVAFTHARRIVAWSEHTRCSLLEDYGVPPEKVVTIHPGVPLEFFLELGREERRETRSGDGGGALRFLFVGNDFSRKGGPDLVRVFLDAILPDHPGAELHLVTGTDEPLPDHAAIRVHRGVRPMSPETRALFAGADVFVLPSHEDTFPIALIEGTAAGLPCVATTVFGNAEIVAEGQTGYLVAPGNRAALADRLRALAADPELRRTMGARGRERARERFDPVTNVGRLLAVLREAAGCPSPSLS